MNHPCAAQAWLEAAERVVPLKKPSHDGNLSAPATLSAGELRVGLEGLLRAEEDADAARLRSVVEAASSALAAPTRAPSPRGCRGEAASWRALLEATRDMVPAPKAAISRRRVCPFRHRCRHGRGHLGCLQGYGVQRDELGRRLPHTALEAKCIAGGTSILTAEGEHGACSPEVKDKALEALDAAVSGLVEGQGAEKPWGRLRRSDLRCAGYLAQYSQFEQVPELARAYEPPPYRSLGLPQKTNMWFGAAGWVTSLHYDSDDNCLCQIDGY